VPEDAGVDLLRLNTLSGAFGTPELTNLPELGAPMPAKVLPLSLFTGSILKTL
jgi:hypothetical protein